jgi:3-dehydroquinate dehydratase/shikimate dehydrogenase
VTLVCVPITVQEPHRASEDAEAALRAGADAVEFRFDGMFEGDVDAEGVEHARRLVRSAPLPVIATCRIEAEGGGYRGSDAGRIELSEGLLSGDAPPRWIDIELVAWQASSEMRERIGAALDHANRDEPRSGLILSSHDFVGRPADLLRRIRAMAEEPRASVHKVAFRARSLRDNLEIAELLAQRTKPMIALGMGEFGLMSRVLAPKWGGFLTFAALRSAEVTAPGQPTVDELLGLYRFRSIRRTTRVYGVVGWPVAQSMSPRVHNAGFGAAEIDAVYLPLPVPPEWEHFKATVGALASDPRLDLGGLSVTAPHKGHLVRLLKEESWEASPRIASVGAANTLAMEKGGRSTIHDTDGPAVAFLLVEAIGELRGKRVMLLGAGGVARSIGAALVEAGALVVVRARRSEQAEDLLGLLAGLGSKAAAEEPGGVDAVVNCTPAGMAGGGAEDESAIADGELAELARANPGLVVMDTVYRPRETPLLRMALGMGLRVIDGESMFVRQAEGQFAIWTGQPPEADLYERLVRSRAE